MPFLHEQLIIEFGRQGLANTPLPAIILDNLKPGYGQRPYQLEAFKRFVMLFTAAPYEEKPKQPYHLLFNMATGSGKTLIMAGLMLYLYEKGYRNFLFFVNSNNVIQKTKENFLNQSASKYLFNTKIVVDGKEVQIKETDTFESADGENINIKFTTIQQLHIDLNNAKENSVTYEDFEDKKLVLIADEAHHLSSATRNSGDLWGSWEGTVLKILEQNSGNMLLEFTATLDYSNPEILKKYQDKVLFRYDLAQFRKDKYSKEITLVRSEYDQDKRILQALILNLYRQELATSHYINLKPVVLFKAKRTIRESEQNKEAFHSLIENLTPAAIEHIEATSDIVPVQKAFAFFKKQGIFAREVVERTQSNFRFENCLSANNDFEAEKNQLLLNTLEEENNPIRAIFAVQKLNEGWDVLNLFDIVRLYEGQNTGGTNTTIGATTLSEAQLIGRGARYFPFALATGDDKYTRKWDNDAGNDLKVLEELYYHTKEDSRYISELKKALIESGIYEDDRNLETKLLQLKPAFKQTEFYKTGRVVLNKRVPKQYSGIHSFADLGVKRRNLQYTLSSGAGSVTNAFNAVEETNGSKKKDLDLAITNIPKQVLHFALSKTPFFYFDSLQRYFPNLKSLSEFAKSTAYLGGLAITFTGTEDRLKQINHTDMLGGLQSLLQTIEDEIKQNLTAYEGSDWIKEYVHKVFKDKELRLPKGSIRADGQEAVVANESWYVYNANYGTDEEKSFVRLFARRFQNLKQKFEDIYLIRNEREVKIINKDGQAFEPDFILFCRQKEGKELIYQVFIEPKGAHLVAHDKWKETFLAQIKKEEKIIQIDTDNYLITGVPFYSYNEENEFGEALDNTLCL